MRDFPLTDVFHTSFREFLVLSRNVSSSFPPSDIMLERAEDVALGQMRKRCRQRCNDATTMRQPTAMTAGLATKLCAKRAEPGPRNPAHGFSKKSEFGNFITPPARRPTFELLHGGSFANLRTAQKCHARGAERPLPGVLFRSLLYVASEIKRQLSLAQ